MNNENVKDNTINHKCSMCGQCCTMFTPITQKEVSIIKEYVKKNNIQPEPHQINEGTYDARCCFLDRKTMKCKINEVKPFVCKDFKCDHKDWQKRREQYNKRAKYNSTYNKMITATFDDLIYDDFGPILTYLIEEYKRHIITLNMQPDTGTLIPFMKGCGREDLLKYMKFYDENNNVVNGDDLI